LFGCLASPGAKGAIRVDATPVVSDPSDLTLTPSLATTHQTSVKHGSLPPLSLGLKTTFTFWPTFTFAGSTPTILVIMVTPSSSVT
jgi:hypothetical protein